MEQNDINRGYLHHRFMKLIPLAIISPLFLITCFAQESELNQLSGNLELNITDVKKGKDLLEIGITLKNKGSNNILTSVPITEDNFKTSYFLAFDEKEMRLQIRQHLFLYPNSVIVELGEPCFALKIIKAGESYSERFLLNYPKAINSYLFAREMDISKYDKYNVQIGVLPFDDTIYQIQDKRPFGHCVVPDDEIKEGTYKGKTLIEVQRILSADSN